MTKKMRRVHCVRVNILPTSSSMCSYSCPHQLLIEVDLGFWCGHLREEGREGFDEIKEAYCRELARTRRTGVDYVRPDMMAVAAGVCLSVRRLSERDGGNEGVEGK